MVTPFEPATLLRLDKTQARANADMLLKQHRNHQAVEARLVAELEDQEHIVFQKNCCARRGIIPSFRRFWMARNGSLQNAKILNNQILILETRIDQYRQEIAGLRFKKRLGIVKSRSIGMNWLDCVNFMRKVVSTDPDLIHGARNSPP